MKMKNVDVIVAVSLLIAAVSTVIRYVVTPSLVYDHWIWKHYWGPVVADAVGHAVEHNGVVANEGYTLVSEFTYGVIVVITLYYLYRLLKKLDVPVDWGFCLALLPVILFGSFSRVLEDTGYFRIPLTYWFISPLIYVQIAMYTLFFLLISWYVENKMKDFTAMGRLCFPVLILSGVTLVFLFLWSFSDLVAYHVQPFFVAMGFLFAVSPLLFDACRNKRLSGSMILFSSGLLLFSPTVMLVFEWMIGNPWGVSSGRRVDVFYVILTFTTLVTLTVWLIARFSKKKNAEPYTKPLNLAMVFGHMLDGLTSYFSIYDPLNMGIPVYMEKHPLPFFLMNSSRGLLFPLLKFVLIMLIIYILDILYRSELKDHRRFVNLLKISVFILGTAPGTRNILRVAMGV